MLPHWFLLMILLFASSCAPELPALSEQKDTAPEANMSPAEPASPTAPVSSPPGELQATDESEDASVATQKTMQCKVVVFVEPDPKWRRLLQQTMEAGGDTVYAAADAAESIQLFRTHGGSKLDANSRIMRRSYPECCPTGSCS